MAVLVYCSPARSGMVAMSGDKVNGESFPIRRYTYDGNIMVLDGNLPHVLEHDAQEICRISGHRLASPQECDAYYRRKRGETILLEEASDEEDYSSIEPEPEPVIPSQTLTTETAPSEQPRRGRPRKG